MNTKSNDDREGQKEFFKMLLAPTMSLEEKMDELWNLPEEDLALLLEQFKSDEDYEICQAIQVVLDEKRGLRS